MTKELIIHTHTNGADIALLEDKRLVEIHHEKNDNQFHVGDIFLGKITKVMGGLNAAFVNVGHEKDAFLHYTDLSPVFKSLSKFTGHAIAGHSDGTLNNFDFLPEINKTGNIKEILENKSFVLVQILKEPISTKGPRLTCEITLAGRYLILSPFSNAVGVSKKIDSADERKRLKILVESLKPKNFGVIVRTVAAGMDSKTLHEDLLHLQEKWAEMCRNLRGAQPVKKVLSEDNKTSILLRDILNDSFSNIATDNLSIAKNMEDYLAQIAPGKVGMVTRHVSKTPIFDQYGITKQIKASFGKKVNTGTGGHLVIEKTEACHVIDVNSGNKTNTEGDQESNALKVNLEAAEEIVRQLRLRDIGGIIVVDFVDMKDPENKRAVYEKMKNLMSADRATHSILALSKFNLMEITRERMRPEVNIETAEECPTCGGSGQITSTLLLIDEIEMELEHLFTIHKSIKVYVHPILEAYIKRGIPSIRMKWCWKFKRWIRFYANENFSITEFKFFDEHDEEIIIE